MVEEEADIEETEATWEDDTQTATNVLMLFLFNSLVNIEHLGLFQINKIKSSTLKPLIWSTDFFNFLHKESLKSCTNLKLNAYFLAQHNITSIIDGSLFYFLRRPIYASLCFQYTIHFVLCSFLNPRLFKFIFFDTIQVFNLRNKI